ncbi:MAG: AbrB/MazE/SpoVT family DNA-binding domain-containing protein [Niveispirillum sp.]|uniref:AbrB/MazE/SpoVT family DNA-binding domain-containing protein n=1 Tax=Niveispirillum sp. TaxID=1917217 RepID=UPI003BA5D3EA
MLVAISKWGNSLGLRIPKGVAEDINLQDGMSVDVRAVDGAIIIKPAPQKVTIDTLMQSYRPEHRHQDIDLGGPVGKEIW